MNKLKTALLLSFVSMASASAAVITPALPVIQKEWGLSNIELQWIVSIFLFAYLLGQWIYGPLANRYGRISALRMGLILNLIGIFISFISAEWGSYGGLLAGRFLTALGSASALVCTFILLNEYFDAKISKTLFPLVSVSFTLEIGLSIWLGGVITTYFSWSAIFIALFIQGLLALFFLRFFPETLKITRSIHPITILNAYVTALRSIKLLTYSIWGGFDLAFSYGYSMISPLLGKAWFSLSPAEYGAFSLINMTGMLLGSFIAIPLLRKCPPRGIVSLSGMGILLSALALLIFYEMNHLNSTLFFLISGVMYILSSFTFSAASHQASNAISDKASASGMLNGVSLSSAVLSLMLISALPFGLLRNFIIVLLGFGILGTSLLTLDNLNRKSMDKSK
jgi:DHA1 family bicyclomycin/chloramphenicol resistance-like MFS transporter